MRMEIKLLFILRFVKAPFHCEDASCVRSCLGVSTYPTTHLMMQVLQR